MKNRILRLVLSTFVCALTGCATTAGSREEDDPKKGFEKNSALVQQIESKATQYWAAKRLLEQCLREQPLSRRSEQEVCLPQRQKLQENEIGPLCEQYWQENNHHVAPRCPCPVQGLISTGYRY